jgi:hypothetical protein
MPKAMKTALADIATVHQARALPLCGSSWGLLFLIP